MIKAFSRKTVCLILAAIFSVAYLRIHSAYQHVVIDSGNLANGFVGHFLFYLSAFVLGLYALILAFKFFSGINRTLTGGSESMVVEIDGQKYFVAMRNSHYHWILIPCEPETIVLKHHKNGSTTERHYIRFTKGIFIIRDMSTLDAPVKRMKNHVPVDMGVPVEEANKEP